jgi:hypothetical protein
MSVRKLALTALLAVVAVLSAAAVSTASSGTISPGGNITSTSIGTFTFTSNSGSIACNVTLTGSLATSASGTLSTAPEAGNPTVGHLFGGTANGCGFGNSATVLISTTNQWAVRNRAVSGSESQNWIDHSQFDITAFGFVKCLITANVKFRYTSETNSRAEVTGIEVISTTNECPENPGLQGNFRISPTQSFTLT